MSLSFGHTHTHTKSFFIIIIIILALSGFCELMGMEGVMNTKRIFMGDPDMRMLRTTV